MDEEASKILLMSQEEMAKYMQTKMVNTDSGNYPDPTPRRRVSEEDIFFEQHISGVLLQAEDRGRGRAPIIDDMARKALTAWLEEHPHRDPHLSHYNISVTYRMRYR